MPHQAVAIPETGPEKGGYTANRRFVGNKEIESRKTLEHQNLLDRQKQNGEFVSTLTRRIRGTWETNRDSKRNIEERLLNDLRSRRNEYGPAQLRKIREQGGSEIYMAITSSKCRGAKSWIRDILMPAGDKAWGLTPTPIPELPKSVENMILERISQTTEPGEDQGVVADRMGKLRDLVIAEIRADAKKRAERMEIKIEDQLVEANWDSEFIEIIDDFVTFPACIVKGPMKYRRKELKWGTMEDQFIPVAKDVVRQESTRVSPFDIYPSPMSRGINDGDLVEHIRFNRGELYSLIGVPGYDEKQVRAVLNTYDHGGLKEWLWNDYERATLENKQYWWRNSNDKDIDALHYWGNAQGKHLIEWGIPRSKIDDPDREYQIDAILVGTFVIRAVMNNDPLGRRPYHKACFDPVPGAFWGNSLPELIEDKQRVCNAAARATVNNMAMASGPMMEVYSDRLAPDEKLEVRPWRIFQTIRGEGANAGTQGNIRFFQPKMNAKELMFIYSEFEQKADDASMIPRYAYGSGDQLGGAGATARGLSMLMNSASKGIKTAIAQLDLNVIRPMIELYYFANMVDPECDPNTKGDAKIKARGANALLIREQTQVERIEFLNLTNNETDQQIIGIDERAEILRETASAMDMPNLIPSTDEFKARQAEKQQQQQEAMKNQPDPDKEKILAEDRRVQSKLMFQEQENKKDREAEAKQSDKERAFKAADTQRQITAARTQKNLEQERAGRSMVTDKDDPDRRTAQILSMMEKLEAKIEKIHDCKESERIRMPAQPAQLPAPAMPPINIDLNIDAINGKIKKTIDVTGRDENNRTNKLEVTEEPVRQPQEKTP